MATRNKNQAKEATKRRVKVGKLQLNKETIKNLNPSKQKQVKGGLIKNIPETEHRTCSCGGPC
jgi:hypothetical protein